MWPLLHSLEPILKDCTTKGRTAKEKKVFYLEETGKQNKKEP